MNMPNLPAPQLGQPPPWFGPGSSLCIRIFKQDEPFIRGNWAIAEFKNNEEIGNAHIDAVC